MVVIIYGLKIEGSEFPGSMILNIVDFKAVRQTKPNKIEITYKDTKAYLEFVDEASTLSSIDVIFNNLKEEEINNRYQPLRFE